MHIVLVIAIFIIRSFWLKLESLFFLLAFVTCHYVALLPKINQIDIRFFISDLQSLQTLAHGVAGMAGIRNINGRELEVAEKLPQGRRCFLRTRRVKRVERRS